MREKVVITAYADDVCYLLEVLCSISGSNAIVSTAKHFYIIVKITDSDKYFIAIQRHFAQFIEHNTFGSILRNDFKIAGPRSKIFGDFINLHSLGEIMEP